jgi:branched-chain amino acid transport system ATP-binding protein
MHERRGAFLAVSALTVQFGGVTALADVSFDIAAHNIIGLIGPNGAGKTTCFNCITRLYTPDSGSIAFRGDDLLRFSAHQIVSRGIARTFQNSVLFEHMSVLDNVLIGLHSRKLGEREAHTAARDVLSYLGLEALTARDVHALPYATRKSVELARALVAQPHLLLLDEPAAGLGPEEVAALGSTIRKIRADFSTTVFMVEHHMGLVMQVCDHIVVLDSGRKLAEGPPEAIRNDRAVLEAYLGVA